MEPDNIRILLVEDNPGDVRLVQEMLRDRVVPAFVLTHAGRLAEALKRLESEPYDVVLLDLNLPDSRGMEAVETFVRRAPHVPIIVQTSLDDEETGLMALRTGADDYLVKGRFDDHVLARVIRYAIERRKTREELRKSGADLEAANASLRASRTAALNLLEDAEQARRQAEESARALRENEATLRGILNATQESIWLFSPEGTALAGNETAFRRFGRTAQEIVGKHMAEILLPELAATRGARLREVVESGHPVEFEDERAGILFRHSFYPVKDAGGGVTSVAIFSRDITHSEQVARDRERLLTMLQERNAEMEAVFSSIQDAVLVYDHQMIVVRANPMFVPTFGFDPLGMGLRDILRRSQCRNLDGSPLVIEDQPTPRALRGETVRSRRCRITRSDGSEMALDTSSSPLRVGDRVLGSVTVWHDITDRLRDEEALRETRDYLESLFNHANAPIICWDAENRITRFNQAFEKLTLHAAEEVLGRDLSMLFPAPTRDESMARIRGALSGERWDVVEIPILRKDGEVRIALWNSANVYAADGTTLLATIAQGQDITERKRAEAALRESEERFRIALQDSPITVASLDLGLRYTWIYNTRHGFNPEQVLGKRPDELIPPEEAAEIMAFLRRALESENPLHGVVSGRTRNEPWTYDISAEPLRDGKGRTSGLTIALVDITDRVRMERELLELERFKIQERSHREWQTTFDCITDLISIHARDGSVLKANRAFLEYFGIGADSLNSRKCFELFHESRIPYPSCPAMLTRASGAPGTIEVADARSGRNLEISTFAYASEEGGLEGCIHVAKDITHRKESEMQLIMNERLAALGQMAAGIAHEINNPLATISGCAEGLLNRTRKGQMDPALFKEYLGIINEEIVRCKTITSSMLSFIRKGDPLKQVLDVHEVLDRTLELIGFQGRLRNVEVLKDYAASGAPASAAEVELKQLFVALLSNALDAMEDTGRLAITTARHEGMLVIRIQDSGPGIPPEIAGRIFDPFFTTKLNAGGTGLGLPIARRIVESLGGTLLLDASSSEGTTFAVHLPAVQDP